MPIAPSAPLQIQPRSRSRRAHARQWYSTIAVCAILFLAALVILPSALGLSPHVVRDGAMSGSIAKGSVTLTESVPATDLAVGDVIVFDAPADSGLGGDLTRRIASIQGAAVTTTRDLDGAEDPWVISLDRATEERVVVDLPFLGSGYSWLTGGSTARWLIGIPFLLLVMLALSEFLVSRGGAGRAGGMRPRPATRGV